MTEPFDPSTSVRCRLRAQARLTILSAVVTTFAVGRFALAEEKAQIPVPEGPKIITARQAGEHIGKEVIVEGRIAATHTSPLSTLLSFKEDFNGLAAVIRPTDRDAFPSEPEDYYKGKWVRLRGQVVEQGNKIRIVLRNPRQIRTLKRPEPREAETTNADTAELTLELLRRLTTIEESLEAIADRLDLLLVALTELPESEQPRVVHRLPGRIPRVEAPPRARYETLRRIKRGMPATEVERLAGLPVFVDIAIEGGETWYYGAGRSISFNGRGRVESLVGFRGR